MHSKIHFPFLSLPLPIQTLRFLSCKKAPLNSNRRSVSGKFVSNFITEMLMFVSKLRTVRCVTLFLGIYNLAVVFLAGFLMVSIYPGCGTEEMLPFAMVGVMSCIRIMSMIGTGIAQEATASIIVSQQQAESSVVDAVIRHERRISYKRWLWWTRFGTVICILQIFGATYLMYIVVKYVSYDGKSSGCFLGNNVEHSGWKWKALVVFLILLWLLVITQCFAGSDVLRWRSFYATRDDAWKAHYREVFDHGIREALCCLGRVKYLSALEEDEVHSVAKLLGDLVAYRASGTGHLELLAGLALLQRHRQTMNSCEELTKAPESVIREAVTFHPFAEAAYTGPLLDVGRNPMLFPCVWLYRQGVLMPWSRNRRPVLEGDNWWRGHAAAFLKYVNLSPEALRRGRVSQVKREAAYFVVVLHHLRTIVIAVRGTETPEDLITDGLCRECPLLTDDVDGLINSENLPPDVSHSILSSFPHYGHSGIVEAARELFMQIDGQPGDQGNCSSETNGFLSSLLGAGCECHGYNIRIVGHSLGGAIATMLGLRLYRRYPNLHVYSYGSLPCVDYIIAEACSSFVTSIVYNDEFSARLSVSSILRLRASAIAALSQDASANSAMICNLARRLLKLSKCQEKVESGRIPTPSLPASDASADVSNHIYRRRHYNYAIKGVGEPGQQLLVQEPTASTDNQDSEILTDRYNEYSQEETGSPYSDILREGFDKSNKDSSDMMSMCIQPFYETAAAGITGGDSISQLVDGVSSTVEVLNGEHQELFLAGLVIHIIPEQVRSIFPLWKGWKVLDRDHRFQAYIANRESFKDIVVSSYMFLDHLPWRCRYAMQRVLESCKTEEGQSDTDLRNRSDIV